MNIKTILLLLILFTIYFGMHVFIYYSILNFFNVIEKKIKFILGITLSILSVGFILSMILLRLSDFFLIKYFYFLTTFWIGLLTTISSAFILAWVLIFLFKSRNVKFLVGILAIAIPFLFGIYGVWNAQNIKIKNIEVTIPKLPINWQGRKIIQLSDVHLGQINGVSFAEKIVQKVNNEKPDLILITGDLFDNMSSKTTEFIKIIDKLESKYGTYFITGNHETYLDVDSVISSLKNSEIHLLNNEVTNIAGLQLVGLAYPQSGELRDKNFIKNLFGYNSELPTILMYHSPTSIIQNNSVSSNQHSNIYWSPDTNFDAVKESGVNLQLSGHTHRGQFFPFNLIVDYIYKKYDYGLFTEEDFNIYTTSGVGTWGPPMRTGSDSEIVVITLH